MVGVAERLRHLVVAQENEGSNPSVHPNTDVSTSVLGRAQGCSAELHSARASGTQPGRRRLGGGAAPMR